MMQQILQQVTLTDVPMIALRDRLRAFARLFDVSVANITVEVQGGFETRNGEPVFLHCTFKEVTLLRGGSIPQVMYAQLDGEADSTAIRPERGVISNVRLSIYA